MKLLTDKPQGMASSETFVLMGIVEDSDKAYACMLDTKDGQMYIEEIHWGHGRNFETSSLHQIDNDEEWNNIYKFVSSATTIFSPKKVKDIIKQGVYFYTQRYTETEDYKERQEKGLA